MESAIEFALRAHAGQVTETEPPLPYIFHPMEVAMLLSEIGKVSDPELLAAAILHDCIEHGGAERGEIEEQFGERVARVVQELTREEPSEESIEGMKKSEIWEIRSELLLAGVAKMSVDAMLIKLADRIANYRVALDQKKGKKLERYAVQTREILRLTEPVRDNELWAALGRLVED